MGLSSFFEKKGDKGIVIFAGKGGLGKTTCSAGLSHYMASKRKRNVLCFSTDPQASLSDIFDRDIFGKGLVSVIPNLDVVEIDADRRVADYQAEVKQKILTMYGLSELPAEIEEYIDSTSAEPATIVNTMSRSARSAGASTIVAPSAANGSLFSRVRL